MEDRDKEMGGTEGGKEAPAIPAAH